MSAKAKKKSTIRGFVVAMDWNDEDEPLSVAIQTEEGLEVLVEEGGEGAGLLDIEDAEVEVIGLLDESDPENPSIRVESVTILESAEEADEEFDEEEFDEDEEEEDEEDFGSEGDYSGDDSEEDEEEDFDDDEDR